MMEPKTLRDNLPWQFIAILFLVSTFIITVAISFFNLQKSKILKEKQNELAAIVSLKVDEITKWRTEHIRDGNILRSIVPANKIIFYFLSTDGSEQKKELMRRMRLFIANYDYNSILLFDSTGIVRLAYPQVDSSFNTAKPNPALVNSDKTRISFSDLHYSEDLPDKIHIDLEIPLFSADNRFIGTIVLRIDPEISLYPLLQSWPTPSKSSETLLIRKEGDSVLYLNELKHQQNTALRLKKSLNDKSLPATMAASGVEGLFEGTDYRGIPVISYLKKIPDSPWFMVAKVDKEEIYGSLKEQIVLISVIALLFILTIAVLMIYFRRNQSIRFYRELNETRNKFFSIISHDLKSPFTSIKGFSELLLDDIQKNKFSNAEKYARIIDDSSQNAVDLISNLVEWAKLQTNRIIINRKIIDVASLVRDVAGLMSPQALQKSIKINITGPPRLEINADKEMISTVLRNLISNSIKFSNPGGMINISFSQKESDVMIEVIDFGVGIKKELKDRILLSDESISSRGTMNEFGSGLGLKLVREFITMHGGKLFVESEPGKHSRFAFTLPLTA